MNNTEKLLPFSIEEWKKRPDDVVTRDGRAVRIAGYNNDAFSTNAILGWLTNDAFSWQMDGTAERDFNDLFMLPEAKVTYANFYSDGAVGMTCDSLEEAITIVEHKGRLARQIPELLVHRYTVRGKEVTTEIVHTY